MPIYEYDCPVCGRFEKIQKISDDPIKECPVCKEKGRSSEVKRLVSASAFHLKGTGWYKTDYASSGSGGSSKSSSGSSSSSSSSSSDGGKSGEGSSSSGGSSDSGSSSDSGTKKEASSKPPGSCGGGCSCH